MQINFDEIKIPSEKLNQVVSENLETIKIHAQKKKRRRFYTVAAAAAVFFTAFSAFCISNPVLASKIPLIGSIFKEVQNEQRYTGNFDAVSEPLTDGNISTANGFTITLSEIYCDTQALYISAMIEAEEPFTEDFRKSTEIDTGDGFVYELYLSGTQDYDFLKSPAEYGIDNEDPEQFSWTPLALRGKYTDDSTFIGSLRIDFNLYPFSLEPALPDSFHWKLTIDQLSTHAHTVEGPWKFETDIAVNSSNTVVTEINESSPNGDVIKSISVTPYEASLHYEYDESKVLPGYEQFDSVQSAMLDGNGTRILDKVGMFPTEPYNLSEITVYYFATPDQETYTAIQNKLYDETFRPQLREYLESIAVHKIVIHPKLPE